ncbi:hypothetical protein M9H77_28838 [Catharanthus roseus]|uniref:Uncharacterized protein n=1 Tax=Catharanthus roseus TaxID=4058 RepID=A0ACC0AI43_CATRO|nr:hypothetical protein M9H77_28838 [Catharanthus roseus]
MKVIFVFYLVIIVAKNTISQKIHNSFDYFKLVIQWPYGFYVPKSKCSRIPDKFTIHDTKIDLLDSKWMDLKSPGIHIIDNQTFWKTQWEKHGTCSIELHKQKAYFDLAIKLYDLYNITKIF